MLVFNRRIIIGTRFYPAGRNFSSSFFFRRSNVRSTTRSSRSRFTRENEREREREGRRSTVQVVARGFFIRSLVGRGRISRRSFFCRWKICTKIYDKGAFKNTLKQAFMNILFIMQLRYIATRKRHMIAIWRKARRFIRDIFFPRSVSRLKISSFRRKGIREGERKGNGKNGETGREILNLEKATFNRANAFENCKNIATTFIAL